MRERCSDLKISSQLLANGPGRRFAQKASPHNLIIYPDILMLSDLTSGPLPILIFLRTHTDRAPLPTAVRKCGTPAHIYLDLPDLNSTERARTQEPNSSGLACWGFFTSSLTQMNSFPCLSFTRTRKSKGVSSMDIAHSFHIRSFRSFPGCSS
jgi:hypothetical protein